MKKVRFNECIAGLTYVFKPYTPVHTWEYTLNDDVANGYINRGVAYEVIPEVEEAVAKPKRRRKKSVK